MTHVLGCAFAAAVLAAAGGAAVTGRPAQEPAAPVFTAAQAADGKAAFTKACAGCHMADLGGHDDAPPLAGVQFQDAWRTRSTRDLLEYLVASMPPGGPALTAETGAFITAYILQSNGAVAGAQALDASTDVAIGALIAGR